MSISWVAVIDPVLIVVSIPLSTTEFPDALREPLASVKDIPIAIAGFVASIGVPILPDVLFRAIFSAIIDFERPASCVISLTARRFTSFDVISPFRDKPSDASISTLWPFAVISPA